MNANSLVGHPTCRTLADLVLVTFAISALLVALRIWCTVGALFLKFESQRSSHEILMSLGVNNP